ncbi:MAG: beta-propeller fold lactonase family protein [Bacteroidales bacterium]|nr:beta-propeller fold lactonase family protein [Bacteroidales bacterium]
MCITQSLNPVVAFLLLSFSACSLIQAADSDTTYYIYVSLRGDDAVAVYKMNPQAGFPEKIYIEPVSGGPASLATDPSKNCLFVARRSSNAISAYKINPATGRLTFINAIPAVDNPVYISTDKSGRFLLSAYYGASKAAVYPIGTSGELLGTATTTITTELNPHAIVTDPENRFLYITNMTGNAILQYQFDSVSGTITALEQPEVIPPDGMGPRHIVFHSSKNIAYVINETGNSVTVYRLNNTTGTLTEVQTISTLPAGYSGTNKCADIHITPDNGFLYASNRGHESIAAFKINPDNDSLMAIGNYATVSTPREFDIDPSGTFLYAAGETSDDLAWYRIDKTTGVLDSIGCIDVGTTPSWVLTIGFDNSTTHTNAFLLPDENSSCKLINAPNPFSGSTSISYFIDKPSRVKINIYNVTGQRISNLMDEKLASGFYTVDWNTAGIPADNAVYFCRLETSYGWDIIKLVCLPGE